MELIITAPTEFPDGNRYQELFITWLSVNSVYNGPIKEFYWGNDGKYHMDLYSDLKNSKSLWDTVAFLRNNGYEVEVTHESWRTNVDFKNGTHPDMLQISITPKKVPGF